MLLILVIVGLGLVLVAKPLKQSPLQTTSSAPPQMTTQEAARLKSLIE